MFVSDSSEGRLLAVHLLNVSGDCDVDRRFVSSETEYFLCDGISEKDRDRACVSNHTSRYTQTHW
jgi:sugar lactone lactonase YvrE